MDQFFFFLSLFIYKEARLLYVCLLSALHQCVRKMAHHTEQPDEASLTLLCAIPELLALVHCTLGVEEGGVECSGHQRLDA